MARFIVKPELMTVEIAESLIGDPPEAWHGRCYEIAVVLAEHMKRAAAVYGHYVGPVDPEGYWSARREHGFIQHGWIIFQRTNQVMDPTRWSFENKEPYIYFGKPDHYDVGGNAAREERIGPCPEFNFSDGCIHLRSATPGHAMTRHIQSLIPDCRVELFTTITVPQAFWLANAHYARLEPFAKEIYKALEDADARGLVPLDNWNRAFREW